MTLEFQVLGGTDLRAGESGGLANILARPKRLALLAYLCLESAEGPVRRDTLLPLFWSESDEPHARAALNQALHVLRSSLGPDVLFVRGRDEVGVDLGVVRCDAVAFRRALASGDRQEALDLYAGDLLPGFHIDAPGFERWLDEERAALRAQALEAALALGASADGEEDPGRAVDAWRRALEIAPESEAAVRGVVLALWRAGRRSAALETYESFAARLYEEYDVDPGQRLESLVGRIRGGEASPAGARRGSRASEWAGAIVAGRAPEPVPAPVATVAPRGRIPTWLRVALPFGLGVAAIVAIGMWASRTPAIPEVPPYESEIEYGKAWAAWLGGDGYDSVRIHASRAIGADSFNARAWALLAQADVLLTRQGGGPARDHLPEALVAARRAVELDDTLAAAWHALATAEWSMWEWDSAAASYRRALSLRTRGPWEALSRADLSALLADLGRCGEAREAIEPYARLEPAARSLRSSVVVRVPYLCRDWKSTIREADRAIVGGDASFDVLRYRFLAGMLEGDTAATSAALRNMRATLGPRPALDRLEALLLVREGDTATARGIVSALADRAANGDPFDGAYSSYVEPLAQLHAVVGDRESAFALLESAMDTKGYLSRLSSDPLFDPLREDPRFDALLARMGLVCRPTDGRQVCREIE